MESIGVSMEEINRLDDKYERRMSKLEDRLTQTDLKLERNNFIEFNIP